jgi:hypothetical protein
MVLQARGVGIVPCRGTIVAWPGPFGEAKLRGRIRLIQTRRGRKIILDNSLSPLRAARAQFAPRVAAYWPGNTPGAIGPERP